MYRVSKKTFEQVRSYEEAPVMGKAFVCFLTGEKVDYSSFRVFKIKTSKGLSKHRFYLNSFYLTMGRASIPLIEEKILRSE